MARRGENIYKRKDERYEGRYIKSYGPDGKALYGSVYAYTYSDVRAKLTDCRKNPATDLNASDMELGDLMEVWLSGINDAKETTIQVYRGHIDNYIVPRIGGIMLKKLTPEIIQETISSLKLAPSTVKVIFAVLKSALKYAEERGLISNIWSRTKLPKIEDSEVRVLTTAERRQLEAIIRDGNDIGILICLYTGLRIGELCALRWSDIDFERSILHVNGTQARVGSEVKILPPKSKSSIRTIPLPPFLIEKLRRLERDGEFVLSHNGSYIDVRIYRRRFKKLLEEAQLPDIKFHALRHTFATRALEVGMDFKTLSEVLGHSSVGITMNLYVHCLDDHKKAQMNKLFKIYSPSNTSSKTE